MDLSTSMQKEQVYQSFVIYLRETTRMLKSIKSSIYDILSVNMRHADSFIQPNMPSITANCKRTMDDLKRISSILRGYAKSKINQKDDEFERKSKIDIMSRQQSRSMKSDFSLNGGGSNKSGYYSQLRDKYRGGVKSTTINDGMITFQQQGESPTKLLRKKDNQSIQDITFYHNNNDVDQVETPIAKLKNIKSVGKLNTLPGLMQEARLLDDDKNKDDKELFSTPHHHSTTADNNIFQQQNRQYSSVSPHLRKNPNPQKFINTDDEDNFYQPVVQQSHLKQPQPQQSHPRSISLHSGKNYSLNVHNYQHPHPHPHPHRHHQNQQQLYHSSYQMQANQMEQTQSMFMQCIYKQENGIEEIIQRNGECLSMLKQIQSNLLRKKKEKAKRKQRRNYHQGNQQNQEPQPHTNYIEKKKKQQSSTK